MLSFALLQYVSTRIIHPIDRACNHGTHILFLVGVALLVYGCRTVALNSYMLSMPFNLAISNTIRADISASTTGS